jgi:hypothetical protein
MATVVTTGLYDFDPNGTNPANLIKDEPQTLQVPGPDDFYFIIPHAAPFFVDSLILKNGAGVPYVEGVDYLTGHQFVEAEDSIGRPICGSIRILRRAIAGQVKITYRTLGGQWGYNDNAILAELANKLYNPLVRSWGMIDVLPATFPPLPHDQDLDTFVGSEELKEGLDAIADILEATAAGSSGAHLTDFNNPHKVNKTQVGLSAVLNYGVATDAEMRAGARSDVYATARGVYLAIAQQALIPLQAHLDDKANPHVVTKKQVGLEFTPNMPVATREQAIDITNNTVLLTPYSAAVLLSAQSDGGRIDALELAFNQYKVDYTNPNRVTAAQVGTLTELEIRQLMQNVSASDTPRFAGMTEAEWRASLPSFTDIETILTSIGAGFTAGSADLGTVVATDPVTPQQIAAALLLKPAAVQVGWNGYGIANGQQLFTLVQSTGAAELPATLGNNWNRFANIELARYWVKPDGSISSAGSQAIAAPLGYRSGTGFDVAKKASQVYASKAANYTVLETGALMRWADATTMMQVWAADVAGVFTQASATVGNEKMIYELDTGAFKAYGMADWVTKVNALLATFAAAPTRTDIRDIQISNNYLAVLFGTGELLVYLIGVAGATVTLTLQTLPGAWGTTFSQVSAMYDHLGVLTTAGKVFFLGSNSQGQQEVNAQLGTFIAVGCGKDFTVTIGTDRRVMFWGDSPDNALLPPA